MGGLVGGPIDEDLPVVLGSKPANYSLNFDRKNIEITFDEFIVLKEINQQLVVSPPLEERLDVRLKNKSIFIEIESELRENTTYTLNFGEAIEDNNEGNQLLNYEFVFSTGDYLDSLSVGGLLLNAKDLMPVEEAVHIMLYDKLSDSVVYNEIPIYIGKTDKEGNFRINNLKADTFKIFALKDVNNNFLFDLPNEEIAFVEDYLMVDPEFFRELITQSQDTTNINKGIDSVNTNQSDTLKTTLSDSLSRKPLIRIPEKLVVDLYLFQEENQVQFLNDYNRKSRNKIDFNFSVPVSDSFYVTYLLPERENWFLKEESVNRDSFVYWIIDKQVREMDSIQMELNYVVLDTMMESVWKKDSLYFIFRDVQKSERNKNDKETDLNVLRLSGLANNSTIELNTKLKLLSETPINYIDTSLIEFYMTKDTSEYREDYKLIRDSVRLREMNFLKEWESVGRYHLIIYPGAVMDFFGNTTDTLDLTFNIRDEESYGVLITEADSIQYPAIFQLLDSNDKIKREEYFDEPEKFRFEYLAPGKYKLKFIEDINANRKWDTGKYIEKKQPEKVYFYQGEIEIRANWDLEIKHNKESRPSPTE